MVHSLSAYPDKSPPAGSAINDPSPIGGAATDRRTNSRVKGAASFQLAPEGAGTRVSVLVDYTLTGALALSASH